MSRSSILREISDERDRQIEKWGDTAQDKLPNATGDVLDPVLMLPYPGIAAHMKKVCDSNSTFANILLEEVFEALSESDPFALRSELKQVAAVCVKWLEKLDRVDLAVPDAGGEAPESQTMIKHFGPLIAAPKGERCTSRALGHRCLLKKQHSGDHRAQTAIWVQEEPR